VPAEDPVAGSADPVERVGFATEVLLRQVLAHQGWHACCRPTSQPALPAVPPSEPLCLGWGHGS